MRPHFHQLELCAGAHHTDGIAGLDGAIKDAHVDDNALVAVIDGIEDQRFQWRCRGRRWGREYRVTTSFQHVLNADAQSWPKRGVLPCRADR